MRIEFCVNNRLEWHLPPSPLVNGSHPMESSIHWRTYLMTSYESKEVGISLVAASAVSFASFQECAVASSALAIAIPSVTEKV